MAGVCLEAEKSYLELEMIAVGDKATLATAEDGRMVRMGAYSQQR